MKQIFVYKQKIENNQTRINSIYAGMLSLSHFQQNFRF